MKDRGKMQQEIGYLMPPLPFEGIAPHYKERATMLD